MRALQSLLYHPIIQKTGLTRPVSKVLGLMASVPMPAFVMRSLIGGYERSGDIRLAEYDLRTDRALSFNEFFTRRFLPGMRPFSGSIAAPVEGYLQLSGASRPGTMHIKGQSCTIADVMGETQATIPAGSYALLYLSPQHYHRVHAPFDMEVQSIRHIPGPLLATSPAASTFHTANYCRNDRVILAGYSPTVGPFRIALIGAVAVGYIHVQGVTRNFLTGRRPDAQYVTHHYRQGDEIGHFALGSTVAICIGSDALGHLAAPPNTYFKLGTPLVP